MTLSIKAVPAGDAAKWNDNHLVITEVESGLLQVGICRPNDGEDYPYATVRISQMDFLRMAWAVDALNPDCDE